MRTPTTYGVWLVLLLVHAASADEIPMVTENIEEFDQEFGILEDKYAKEMDEENLAEAEKEINKHNEDYKEGKTRSIEKLNEDDEMSEDEFKHEREGLNPPKVAEYLAERLGGGLLEAPDSVKNDPANRAKMDALYEEIDRQGLPLPGNFDSSRSGWVTSVKDQRTCQSCAAFASTAIHETCMLKAGASNVNDMDLSEQQLIDCAYNPKAGIKGCKGAFPDSYPLWFRANGGHGMHEHQYGYRGNHPTYQCPPILPWKSGAQVGNVHIDFQCSAEKIKKLIITYGAVLVGVSANEPAFRHYRGGIIDWCRGGFFSPPYDHTVMLYGYNSHGGVEYWLGKNSWGKGWGENGFFRIALGKNMCSVEKMCIAVACRGDLDAQPPPPPPPPPVIPRSLTCDVRGLFPNAQGRLTLRVGENSLTTLYVSDVVCNQGMCSPYNPAGIHNACVYICGEVSCDP